jgi:predicted RNA binding protein YcfA (HicA-like mRNA interferase family)
MKARDLIKLLEKEGWIWVTTCGSHRQFKHPLKAGRVTVPGKLSKDVDIGTLKNILRQAGIEVKLK